MHEDREGNDREADCDYGFALRQIERKRERKSKCQRAPQSTPEQYVLMPDTDAKSRPRIQGADWIDGDGARQRHQQDRRDDRWPCGQEVLTGLMHADEEKHERVCHEGSVFQNA